jgi:hypothetical protein
MSSQGSSTPLSQGGEQPGKLNPSEREACAQATHTRAPGVLAIETVHGPRRHGGAQAAWPLRRCTGAPGGTGVGSVGWRGSRVGGLAWQQGRWLGVAAGPMANCNCARCVENRGAWTSLIMAFVA